MIRLGRESVTLDPTATTGKVVNIGQERESEINSEMEIIGSRELAEKVVDALGVKTIIYGPPARNSEAEPLSKKFSQDINRILRIPVNLLVHSYRMIRGPDPLRELKERDLAIRLVMGNLNIFPIKKSNIIFISYEAANPLLAHDVVKDLIGFYLDKHIAAHRTAGSYEFFDEQSKHIRESLAESEMRLNKLKNQTGTGSIEEQRNILLQRIGDLRKEIEDTQSSLASSVAKVEAMKGNLAKIPETLEMAQTTGWPGSAADEVQKRLNELILKEQQLLSTYTEGSIPVQEVRRQIREARSLLRKTQEIRQVTRGVNENYQQMQKELLTEESNVSGLLAKSNILETQLAQSESDLKKLNDTELLLKKYQRETQIQENNYRNYAESLEQARIDNALEMEKISNISVIQAPSLPLKPVYPRKKLNLALGLFFGLFGGLTLALVSEYFDHTFKKPEDIEKRLKIPALIALPILKMDKSLPVIEEFSISNLQQKHLLFVNERFGNLIPVDNTHPEKASMSIGPGLNNCQVFSFTSCYKGEGVSTVAVLFAATLARRTDRRVLLVDCNLQKPSIGRLLGLNQQEGPRAFSSSNNLNLAGTIEPSSVANLDALCSMNNSFALNLSTYKALNNCMELLKREYAYIVFDSPALEEGADAISIARLSDSVILVVEAERTNWEVAIKEKEKILQANLGLSGVILNKRKFYIPEWLYKSI